MLSIETAKKLKAAGLEWTPAMNDFFILPERGLDDRLFVIAEIPATFALLQGQPVFAFQGAVEWALDFILAAEALWMPTEAQLRQALERRLPDTRMTLHISADGYECQLHTESPQQFRASSAEEAYAAALLSVLQPPT